MFLPMHPLLALIEREFMRRRLTLKLETLNDHLLRDIGLERHMIDQAVAAELPGVFDGGPRPEADVHAGRRASALQGCG